MSVWGGKKAFMKSPQGWGPGSGGRLVGRGGWPQSDQTSGGGLEMFVFSPKSLLQGENEYVHRLLRKQRRPREAVQVGQAG